MLLQAEKFWEKRKRTHYLVWRWLSVRSNSTW